MRTGYNVREGSKMLAERRAEHERCMAVSEAMIRRRRIAQLCRRALQLLDEPTRVAA